VPKNINSLLSSLNKKLLPLALAFYLLSSITLIPAFSNPNTPPHTQKQTSIPESNLYSVKVEHGSHHTISGAKRSYVLYIPQTNSALPKGPFPVVVMVHGFLMSSNQQSNTCYFLAQRGFVVLAPNMSKVMLGSTNRTENVNDVVDQTVWLVEQSKKPDSKYYGLVDPKRMAIAGNSSGGAVCFEVALRAQEVGTPFRTLCSLEGVPWDRTLNKMKDIEPMHILALRAESCLCNYHWNVLAYLKQLKFAADDVKVNGAHHCDAENPTSIGCMSVCGSSHEKFRRLFQLITYLYLRDTLDAPKLYNPTKSFIEVVNEMQRKGTVIAHLDNMQSNKISSKSNAIETSK